MTYKKFLLDEEADLTSSRLDRCSFIDPFAALRLLLDKDNTKFSARMPDYTAGPPFRSRKGQIKALRNADHVVDFDLCARLRKVPNDAVDSRSPIIEDHQC